GEEFASHERAVRDWRTQASDAFVKAYFESADDETRAAAPLLDLFVVEGAMGDLHEALTRHPERLELLLRGLPPERRGS
ncbi:MAG TPA: hypothetical protein VF801_14605, partial [Rhodocyclaceae bacterium]